MGYTDEVPCPTSKGVIRIFQYSFSQVRKAAAAFLAPWLVLPIGAWIVTGTVDKNAIFATLATSLAAALAAFFAPNAPKASA